jgi:8-hydroxy-5-deazaflavin:NADPH oxidoreductase
MIGIVGGTGDFGQGLAERLRRIGEEVELGSRTPHDEFVSNRDCAEDADIVFLSVPPSGLAEMCGNLAGSLDGKIVVSVASPVVFTDGKPGAEPGELSLAELGAQAAPGARMVAGFHTVSAKALANVDEPLDEDVILCGDDEEAKAVVGALAERIVAGRAVDAGRLEVARWLEPVTAVLLNVNRRYKASSGVRVTGLP